jgi:hypothetical protein
MSAGLLHRLAARATSTAWTLRSDARLPFGAAGAEPAQDAVPPLMEAAAAQTRAPVPSRTDALMPDSPASGHAGPRPAQAAPVAAQALGPLPAPAETALPPPPARPPQQLAVPRAPPATRTMEQAEFEPAPLMPAMPTNAPPRIAAEPAALRASQREAPAPLLPLLPQAAAQALARTHSLQAAASAAARSAAPAIASPETEVHIHIGRIDVTALHEAPRPKPRARERAQPVSLDAYLTARSAKS